MATFKINGKNFATQDEVGLLELKQLSGVLSFHFWMLDSSDQALGIDSEDI